MTSDNSNSRTAPINTTYCHTWLIAFSNRNQDLKLVTLGICSVGNCADSPVPDALCGLHP